MNREITPIQPDDRTCEIIKSEFPAHPYERFYFVAFDQRTASNARPLMREVWGNDYVEKYVDCREVIGISNWGLGLWHDKFVFDHSVWDNFSDLSFEDQQFLIMLTQEQKIGQFFNVRPNIRFGDKKIGMFGKFRAWLKSKL